jgi:hypothetical protein
MNINWNQEATKEKEAIVKVLWRDYLKANPNLNSEEKESRLIGFRAALLASESITYPWMETNE